MIIRAAKISDLNAIKSLEDECFAQNERVSKEAFREFLAKFCDDIFLACENSELAGQIITQSTAKRDFDDEMFAGVKFFEPNGEWLMVTSLAVSAKFRGRGIAAALLKQAQEHAKTLGKKGVVLTCNANLVKFYEKFSFANEGICTSNFGGAKWHQMRWEIKGSNLD